MTDTTETESLIKKQPSLYSAPLYPADKNSLSHKRIGVLLTNLGTPNGTDYWNMRRYLSEFLSDRRVIEWPKLLWQPILQSIVLSLRPQKSGAAYARIWNKIQNESPLRTTTRSQAEKLAALLQADMLPASRQKNAAVELPQTQANEQSADTESACENKAKTGKAGSGIKTAVTVDWAMRYGSPSIAAQTAAMMAQGCTHIVIIPLYPQYSASTTATVNDAFFDILKTLRFQPAIRTAPAYADDPVYIEALAHSVRAHLANLPYQPEKLIASYHGVPQSYIRRGDPYYHECARTTAALRQKLGLDENRLLMCFQSRFGPEEWLQPYTDKTIAALAQNGVRSLAVFNPGFVADCLETVDEIGNEAAAIFRENGGENFSHIPCLNDSEEGMRVIAHIVKRELQGWI